MKSVVENLEPTKVKLTVEVAYDELKPSIEHAYKHIGEQVNVPGFRKGKIPARIIDQRVGRGAVLEQAINEGLPGFYSDAVRENNLRPLGQPTIDVTKVPDVAETEGELHFTAEVEIRPTLELPALDSISVSVDDIEVTDEDVSERLDALRERFGTLVGVDRPAADGDFVVIDMTASVDDEEIDSVSGTSYQIGSGNMLEGLDEALIGLSADESTTFSAPLAGGDHAGSDSVIAVTVSSVKTRDLPEADDDFAELASEFDTLAELKDDLREQAKSAKTSNQAVQARDALLEAIKDVLEIPVPAGVIEAEVNRHLEGENRLEDDEHRAEVVEEATASLTNQILLDTLAESLEIKVSQNELLEYLVSASRQYGMDTNEFIKSLDEGGQIPSVVAEVARSKSLAVALRQVKVTDASGNDVDLSEFIGSDADDAAVEQLAQVTEAAQAAAAEQDKADEAEGDNA